MVNNMKLTSKLIALLSAMLISATAFADFNMPFFDDNNDDEDFYRWYYYNSQRQQGQDRAGDASRRYRPDPRRYSDDGYYGSNRGNGSGSGRGRAEGRGGAERSHRPGRRSGGLSGADPAG